MNLLSLDTTKCAQCQACADVCPMGVIEIAADGFPEPKSYAYRLCINCGYCVDVCVYDALSHRFRKRSSDSSAAMRRYEVLQKRKGQQNQKQ